MLSTLQNGKNSNVPESAASSRLNPSRMELNKKINHNHVKNTYIYMNVYHTKYYSGRRCLLGKRGKTTVQGKK